MGKNDLNLFELLKLNIISGRFQQGKELVEKISIKDLHDCLMEIAYENYNLTSYCFITFLIASNERAEYHSLASDILGVPLCHLKGAYQGALFHARRSLELSPNNVEYQEWMLYFYEIPDKLVSREEATKLAKEILKNKPDSLIAKEVLE